MSRRYYVFIALMLFASSSLHAQWTQTSGPEGATIMALAADSKHVLSVINNDVYEYVGGEWIVRGHVDRLYSNG
ncbi:MAG: hypothetical protein H7X80_11215, partial [bacterium]|nr:hypothetical protein [Candidatus Kapabacteria bacterium]